MKTASAALTAHIDREVTSLTMAVKVILTTYQPQIIAVTKANPGQIELEWAPDYETGDSVRIVGVRGMTELNGQDFLLTKVDATHYTIGVNTTSYGTYTAKGEARKIIGFTEFVEDLTFSNVIYRAAVGYMPRSIKGGSDLSVDNLEIVGLMSNKVKAQAAGLVLQGLSDEDLYVGRFDNARVELFFLNWNDLSQGRIILPGSGVIGQIKMRRSVHESELRGMTSFLQQTVGGLYSKLCRARLGDDITDYRREGFGCKVRLDPPKSARATAYTVRPPYDAALGSVVKPTTFNNRYFQCTVAGTSHATTEPTWSKRIDSTTTDGTATFKAIQALRVFGSVTAVLNTRFFSDNARNEPPTTGQGVNTGTAKYAIRRVNTSADWFEIEGDLVSFFGTGQTFAVNGSQANDGNYTVQSTTLNNGRTRITVVEEIPNDKAGGTIGAPLLLSTGFFAFGLLRFLTGANKGIAKEVKEFTLTSYTIVDVDTGTQLFMVDGDQTAFFAADQRFAVAGSTGNDGQYDIVTATYNAIDDVTEIEVVQAIPDATIDGNILAGPGQFEMFERFPFDIQVGDDYVVNAGCDLSKEVCGTKFDNMYNRRAEDEIPGQDVAALYPNASGGGV